MPAPMPPPGIAAFVFSLFQHRVSGELPIRERF
jgi:hypothetical protein